MSEMIERVARAICRRYHNDPDWTGGGSWDGDSFVRGRPAWKQWEDDARAAIAAMREPTEAMASDPMANCYNTGIYGDKEVRRIWRSMIDAALVSSEDRGSHD